jgi:hypothetical protein
MDGCARSERVIRGTARRLTIRLDILSRRHSANRLEVPVVWQLAPRPFECEKLPGLTKYASMSFVVSRTPKQQHGRRASDNDDLGPLGKAFKLLRKRVERFPDVG